MNPLLMVALMMGNQNSSKKESKTPTAGESEESAVASKSLHSHNPGELPLTSVDAMTAVRDEVAEFSAAAIAKLDETTPSLNTVKGIRETYPSAFKPVASQDKMAKCLETVDGCLADFEDSRNKMARAADEGVKSVKIILANEGAITNQKEENCVKFKAELAALVDKTNNKLEVVREAATQLKDEIERAKVDNELSKHNEAVRSLLDTAEETVQVGRTLKERVNNGDTKAEEAATFLQAKQAQTVSELTETLDEMKLFVAANKDSLGGDELVKVMDSIVSSTQKCGSLDGTFQDLFPAAG